MADQQVFGSYRDTKGPIETNKWVEEQRALGNPKILSKKDWYDKNKVDIKLKDLDKKLDFIISKFPK